MPTEEYYKTNQVGTGQGRWKQYEELAKKVCLFDQLSFSIGTEKIYSFADSKEGIKQITGISGIKHQIDIHLIHGCQHLVGECKYYSARVEKSVIASFIKVIEDIRSNEPAWIIVPVFFSKEGFQSGARKMAEYYGIILVEIKDDYLRRSCRMTIRETKPEYCSLVYYFEDGSRIEDADNQLWFSDSGIIKSGRDLLGYIGDIRTINGDEFDWENEVGPFVCNNDRNKRVIALDSESKALCRIEGEIFGTISIKECEKTTLHRIAILTIAPETRFSVFEDGSIEKELS